MAQPVQIKNYSPEAYFDFTRPADTTTYAALDHVTSSATGASVTPMKFPVTKEPNGSGFITGARIMKGSTGVTGATFRLWLFIREPFAAAGYPADNAALTFTETSFRSCIGFFDFDAANWITGTTSAYCDNTFEKSLPFSLDKVGAMPSSDSYAVAGQVFDRTQIIYGLLQATGAYAPGNAETFRVALDISAVPGSSRSMGSGDVVQGGAADDAAASGNPVPVGGIYNSALPTYTNGDRTQLQSTARGEVLATLSTGGSANTMASSGADGVTNTLNALYLMARPSRYNGSTWDRERGNHNQTVFTSAARTATPTPFDGVNYNGRGLHLVIDCTAIVSSPSVVFTVQGKDDISGKFYTILASAAIVGTGTTVLRIFPGSTVTANLAANDIITRDYRVIATHGNSDSITYTVGASLIV